MSSAILVHHSFDGGWPWAADYWYEQWRREGPTAFHRSAAKEKPSVTEVLPAADREVHRLACLGVRLRLEELQALPNLRAVFVAGIPPEEAGAIEARGISVIQHNSEGFWGQSVAEYALALTLCGLRRIPQQHRQIIEDPSPWDYASAAGQPGQRGNQFGDDPRFSHGALARQRIRIVGMGNIGARYAKWCRTIGADVAGWDPYASEPCFHLPDARRERYLERLVTDADVFAPMVPLIESTEGLIKAEHIDALPKGCLVVMVTRAHVLDTEALKRRVLANELALAADVFEEEPLPLDHPLLGRESVVHTPHNAGRTRDANFAWVEDALNRFPPL